MFQTRVQLLPGKWHAHVIRQHERCKLCHLKVTELDLVYQWGNSHYVYNSIYNEDRTFYSISTVTPEENNQKCLLASLISGKHVNITLNTAYVQSLMLPTAALCCGVKHTYLGQQHGRVGSTCSLASAAFNSENQIKYFWGCLFPDIKAEILLYTGVCFKTTFKYLKYIYTEHVSFLYI